MSHRAVLGLAALCVSAGPAAAVSMSAESGSEPAPEVKIRVPQGFEAEAFARDLGCVGHLAVRDDGTVYATLRREDCAPDGKGIVALKDTDGDGQADRQKRFGDRTGTGLALWRGHLYFGSSTEIVRFPLEQSDMVPAEEPEIIVSGFDPQDQHATKAMTITDQGALFVNVGAPSNACQEEMRTPGSPGRMPCPQLDRAAGIWRYSAETTGQRHNAEDRYATGIRNGMALDWHPGAEQVVFSSHGRDSLHGLFPDRFTEEENAELPAEEIHRLRSGANYGWPYTYWDPTREQRMLAPEYGGNGEEPAKSDEFQPPIASAPAHWGPNDLVVYKAEPFPEAFHHGAFIAYHGSWNRAPLPQAGYRIGFLPMDRSGKVTGDLVTFADGFKGTDVLRSPGEAAHRPSGLAVGPEGALYVADDVGGWIWRISYGG